MEVGETIHSEGSLGELLPRGSLASLIDPGKSEGSRMLSGTLSPLLKLL